MSRVELIARVKARRESLGISLENLANISKLGYRTVMRFFAGDDLKISSLEKMTEVLGLDLAGNEIIDVETLKNQRAELKARYVVSLVQDISSLEMQGLDEEDITKLIEETKEQFLHGEYQKKLWVD